MSNIRYIRRTQTVDGGIFSSTSITANFLPEGVGARSLNWMQRVYDRVGASQTQSARYGATREVRVARMSSSSSRLTETPHPAASACNRRSSDILGRRLRWRHITMHINLPLSSRGATLRNSVLPNGTDASCPRVEIHTQQRVAEQLPTETQRLGS